MRKIRQQRPAPPRTPLLGENQPAEILEEIPEQGIRFEKRDLPSLDWAVEYGVGVDPEAVRQILYPEKLLSLLMVQWRREALQRNRAYRSRHKSKVALINKLLHCRLLPETRKALTRELYPYGFAGDEKPMVIDGKIVHAVRLEDGRPYKCQNRLEFDRLNLDIDPTKKNRLLSDIITQLADYFFGRLSISGAQIYGLIGRLIREAHPDSNMQVGLPDGTTKPLKTPSIFQVGNERAVRARDRKRELRNQ